MASSETWARRVAAWRASGQTADTFAAGRGFAGSTLPWWASHLGRQKAALVRVVPTRDVERATSIEVHVGAARVVVRRGFDRALLASVVEALGEKATS